MGGIPYKVSYLMETKGRLRTKLNSRGANITDETTFRGYIDQVDNAGKALFWPGIAYTGTYYKQIVQYGDVWYYEYIFTTSGTLNFSTAISNVDWYLIGGGGAGGHMDDVLAAFSSNKGSGGGSAFDDYATGISVPSGNYTLTIGAQSGTTSISVAENLISAPPGGDGSFGFGPTGGLGKTTPYYLYGDTRYQFGTGSNGGDGNDDGGVGGPGCTIVKGVYAGRASRIKYSYNNRWYSSPLPSSEGYGSGGRGQPIGDAIGSSYYMFSVQGVGAQGVALMRIPV